MLLKIVLDSNYKFSGWSVISPSNIDVVSAITSVSDGVVVILNIDLDAATALIKTAKEHDLLMEELAGYESGGSLVAKIDYTEIRIANMVANMVGV